MEELPQLSSFFVANLYLEKVELRGSHGGDFTWRGDYCIYQKPYVAWFQLNEMIVTCLRIGKKTTFLCDCIFIDVRIYSSYAHSTFLHMQGALDLYLKKVGLIDQDQVLIFHHRICPWYLVFCVWLAIFQPPHCGWTGAGPRLSLKCLKCLSEVGCLQLCELLGLHKPCYSP